MQKSNIIPAIKYAYYYVVAHLVLMTKYDKKYIAGRHFKGPHHNIVAPGWKWVVDDARGCRKMKVNQSIPWPVSPFVAVGDEATVIFDPDDLNNFQSRGIYYQTYGKIILGKGTIIGPNVGLITANHDLDDYDKHSVIKDIKFGERCWIGMNSVIMSGVVLGEHTIVGAGSVVTHSFPEGHCIIAGNPAKIIRQIDD